MRSQTPNVPQALAQLNNMINQNPNFTIEINLEETNMVLAALQELPAKFCNPLSEKIKAQAQSQIAELQALTQEPVAEPAGE
jgi:hypothetical protein